MIINILDTSNDFHLINVSNICFIKTTELQYRKERPVSKIFLVCGTCIHVYESKENLEKRIKNIYYATKEIIMPPKKLLEVNLSRFILSQIKERKDVSGFRIENMCSKGTPDLFLSFEGKYCAWIELKTEKPQLRHEQNVWFYKYSKNIPSFVLCETELSYNIYFYPFTTIKLNKKLNKIVSEPNILLKCRNDQLLFYLKAIIKEEYYD